MNDEEVYSVLLLDLSKGTVGWKDKIVVENEVSSTILKLNFGQDFEVEVYIQGFSLKSDLFNNFEAGASPKEDFLSTLQC